jgi:tetratricopeptide (TPR) repeat protein
LNRTKNDIKIIQEALGINTKNCNYTCSISQENILSLKGQIANLVTEQKKQQEFFEKHNKNIEQALANTNDKLKEFSYVYFKSTNNSLHEEFIVKTKSISEKLDIQKKKNVESISSIDLDNCIKNSFDFVDTLGSTSIVTEKIEDETHFRTEPESIPQESKIEIIKKYEDLTNNDSVLSPYMKAIFFKNLGIAYAEIGDKTKSNKNLGNAINLYKDLLGQDSEEVKVVNELQAKLK